MKAKSSPTAKETYFQCSIKTIGCAWLLSSCFLSLSLCHWLYTHTLSGSFSLGLALFLFLQMRLRLKLWKTVTNFPIEGGNVSSVFLPEKM